MTSFLLSQVKAEEEEDVLSAPMRIDFRGSYLDFVAAVPVVLRQPFSKLGKEEKRLFRIRLRDFHS